MLNSQKDISFLNLSYRFCIQSSCADIAFHNLFSQSNMQDWCAPLRCYRIQYNLQALVTLLIKKRFN